MPNNALAIRVSENAALSNTLLRLEDSLDRAARENLNSVLSQNGQNLDAFTGTEVLAMVATEKLRLVNGMDLAAIMIRGKLLQEIESQALHTVHPNHYDTLEALAEDQGISLSELSDIRMMTQVVFPYVEQTLGIPVAQIWETIGKTKFRTLVPVLRAIITGEEPGRGSARDNYLRIMEDTAASLRAANPGAEIDDGEVRRQAVDDLLVAGQQMRSRELQEHIRDGEVTPALQPTIVTGPDGRKYMISEVDDDQLLVVRRKLGRHMASPNTVTLPQDTRRRQTEAFRHPIIRDFTRLVEG